MSVILAIDPAWTEKNPSGVALLRIHGGNCSVAAVCPSYDSFLELALTGRVEWTRRSFRGSVPKMGNILEAAQSVVGAIVDLVVLDMPMATVPILRRRVADQTVSTIFGSRGCAAHSPGPQRPGKLGARIYDELLDAGFTLATTKTPLPFSPAIVECYPHTALLSLLSRDYRVPYKVSNSRKYWGSMPKLSRIANLLTELNAISAALERELGPFHVPLPNAPDVRTLSELKRFEDALDALVCAWVGLIWLKQEAVPLGDETAAIWCPKGVCSCPEGANGSRPMSAGS